MQISPVNILLVFKTSSRHVFKASSTHVFKPSLRHIFKKSSRRLQCNNILSSKRSSKTSSRPLKDVFKTCLEDVFKPSWRPKNVCWVCTIKIALVNFHAWSFFLIVLVTLSNSIYNRQYQNKYWYWILLLRF